MNAMLNPAQERDAFQAEATAKVVACFAGGADRCQGYAPTGSGKTHIAASVWNALDTGGVLVLVSPNRSVAQTEAKFKSLCPGGARTLQVNSNPKATRSVAEIMAHLQKAGSRLIFATDTSLPLVSEALSECRMKADLFIIDEAHRNSAARNKAVTAYWAEEAVQRVPAKRRLYMTATPRRWKPTGDDDNIRIFSMDDEKLYGPVAFDLSFDEAERRGIVLPVRVVGLTTDNAEIATMFTENPKMKQIWEGGRQDYREIAAHLGIYKAVTDGIPSPDGEGEPYKPQRIMINFNRVHEANGFVKRHALVMERLGITDVMAFVVTANTPQAVREQVKTCTEELDYAGRKLSHVVIAQCGALTESYDLPDLDLTILVTPKRSTVAILQLIGRTTRLPVKSAKRFASVMTTDLNVDEDDSLIVAVVRELIKLSESFRHSLKEGKETAPLSGERTPISIGRLDNRPLPEDFEKSLRLAVYPQEHGVWARPLPEKLREFAAEYGHMSPTSTYVCPDGYTLGYYVWHIRHPDSGMRVPAEVADELTAMGFKWEPRKAWTYEFVSDMEEYKREHGNLDVPVSYIAPSGRHAGQHCSRIRNGRTPVDEETRSILTAMGFSFEPLIGRLTDEIVSECRRRYRAGGETYVTLSAEFGFTKETIGAAIRGGFPDASEPPLTAGEIQKARVDTLKRRQ